MVRIPTGLKVSPDVELKEGGQIINMSEARLNDAVYMLFKAAMGMPPRECDIRIMMDMTCKERITNPMQAILRPDEVSGRSHTIKYDVRLETLLEESLDYMEDHWIKGTHPHRQEVVNYFEDGVLHWLIEAEEHLCAQAELTTEGFTQERTPDNPLGEDDGRKD